MEVFKNKLRFDVLKESGLLGPKKISFVSLKEDENALLDLDQVIYDVALKEVEPAQYYAFYFAFECHADWNGVAEKTKGNFGINLQVDSAETYAVKAANSIRKALKEDDRLEAWFDKQK